MLRNIDWSKTREYRSGSKHEPIEFYIQAIANSNKIDLLLGYFSFATINLLSLGFARFLSNGGKMRVVANNILSKEDKNALLVSENIESESNKLINLNDFEELKNNLSSYNKHFFECIAWLIIKGRIEIILVKPKGKAGISHYKSGVFYDKEHQIGFKASCNFTPYGMLENLEEVDIFLSWENSRSSKAIQGQQEYFESLITKTNENVEYIDYTDIEVAIKDEFGNKSLEELVYDEIELINLKQKSYQKAGFLRCLENLNHDLKQSTNKPLFPFKEGPRDYQKDAYNNWISNNEQGIFAMATGTGKTITSLNCALELYNIENKYEILILVPTNDLLFQWKDEVKRFNFQNIIAVSSKTEDEKKLASLTASLLFGEQSDFVIITTYSTFTRPKFQHYLKDLPKSTLLIADEAHNVGAPQVKTAFRKLKLNRRIALSATPKRKYDPEGSSEMETFFNDSSPYTYNYPMEKAIEKGVLCNYNYYPILVELEPDELDEYQKISIQLMKYFDSNTGKFKDVEEVNALLLKRKRVVHKAKNKLVAFKKILKNEFQHRKNLKYTFAYVPEGLDKNAIDEHRIVFDYNNAVMDVDKDVRVAAYLGNTPNKQDLLSAFSSGEIDVLTSMKCLDEGVDVPRTELAIFCSSTGNPRQFIQRRGRVLRTHPDKSKAVIYDLVVVPTFNVDENSNSFKIERSLFRNELERVIHFAFMALNVFDVVEELSPMCENYNLDIYEIKDALNN